VSDGSKPLAGVCRRALAVRNRRDLPIRVWFVEAEKRVDNPPQVDNPPHKTEF